MRTQSIAAYKNPLGADSQIIKQTFLAARNSPAKRIAFVAGLHGDEMEGVYICHLLVRYLRQLKAADPGAFLGEVHVYPAVNPSATNNGTRLWPFFSVDMNRLMGPGKSHALAQSAAHELLEDIKASADLVVDLHAGNQQLMELPQIRIIKDCEKKLLPLARLCNVDVVWVHPAADVLRMALGYNLNQAKIPALVLETGVGLRINPQTCEQLFRGMVHLMRETGILSVDQDPNINQPLIVHPSEVYQIQAKRAGLFISQVRLGERMNKGDKVGEVVDPVHGEVLEEIRLPFSGLIFTLREHPLAYEGSLLVRMALDGRDL